MEKSRKIQCNCNSDGNVNLTILTDCKLVVIESDSISHLSADGNYTWINQRCGKKTLVPNTLGHYRKLLPDFAFIRCHKSYLVNLRYFESLNKRSNKLVIAGQEIPVSIRRMKFVVNAILSFYNVHC